MADSYEDQMTRHSVYLQKQAAHIVNERVIPSIKAIDKRIREILSRDDIQELGKRDFNAMIKAVESIIQAELPVMWALVTEDLANLGYYEAEFNAKVIEAIAGKPLTVPAQSSIASYAASQTLILEGQVPTVGKFSEIISKYSASTQESITQTIKAGYDRGLTNQQVIQQIRGTKKAGYSDGVLAINTRNADAIVRTGMSAYTDAGKDKLAAENKDITEEWLFSSVLDSSTTMGCRFYSNTRWKYNDPKAPKIPRHYRCRSVKLIVIKGIDPLVGDRVAKGAKGGTQVDAKMSQDEFLKRQPKYFIEESLDAKWREKLFSEGVTIKQFFDQVNQRPYSLSELKKSDSKDVLSAISRAGLSGDKDKKTKRKVSINKAASIEGAKANISKISSASNKKSPSGDVKISKSDGNAVGKVKTQSITSTGKLTGSEESYLEYYKADGFYKMNDVLRNKSKYSTTDIDSAESMLSGINSAIGKSKASNDAILYRGVRSNDLFDALSEGSVGAKLPIKTPQSTTRNPSVALTYSGAIKAGDNYLSAGDGSVIFKVNTKKGQKMLDMENLKGVGKTSESEVLIGSGGNYVIKSVSNRYDTEGRVAAKIVEVDYED